MEHKNILSSGQKILVLVSGQIYLKEFLEYQGPKTSMHYGPTVLVKNVCPEGGTVSEDPDNVIYAILEDGKLTKNFYFPKQ